MTYAEAIQFLYGLRLFGLKLGLENTLKLAELAGNPHQKLRFIHVAGTNGKGSTCAMLESIYRAAGLRVGLFTSPHLVSFRERIQVDRSLISEADVVRLVGELKDQIERAWPKPEAAAAKFSLRHGRDAADRSAGFQPASSTGIPARSPTPGGTDAARTCTQDACATTQDACATLPTFFEVVTVIALRYFVERKCDLVIWETGMGGRLDATNIVTPLASVITNIHFDHQKWLGNTRAEIAAEKAGIIKPGVPVITAADAPEALEVIERTAAKLNAPLSKVGQASRLPTAAALPLLGEHQKLNAALAIATVRVLQNKISVGDESIRRGLETVQWPGRLQLIKTKSGQAILLDGAHNPDGARALRAALLDELGHLVNRRDACATLVFGVLADKDWPLMCETLAPLAGRILLAPVHSERTASPDALREACAKSNPAAQTIACSSLADALKLSARDPFVVITGSLYLVGEAMELLELSPAASASERELNEWTMKK